MRSGSVSECLNKKRRDSCRSVSRTEYHKSVQKARQKPVISMVRVSLSLLLHTTRVSHCTHCISAVLDQIQDEWEPCTSSDVRHLVPDKKPHITEVAKSSALLISRSNFSMNRPREKTCILSNPPSVYCSTLSRDPLTVRCSLGSSRAGSNPRAENYQAFAAALPHHAAMLIQLNNTQLYMKEARTSLTEAKESLGNKRADLLQMWSRRQTLEEMTRILDQMYDWTGLF